MENIENQVSASPDLRQLREQYESLRGLVVSTLVLIIVLSASLDLFLLRQLKFTRAELNAVRPAASQIISEYNSGLGKNMDDFVRKITDYGQTHPDFAPILAKYGIKPGVPAAAAPAAPAAAPALPAKAKK